MLRQIYWREILLELFTSWVYFFFVLSFSYHCKVCNEYDIENNIKVTWLTDWNSKTSVTKPTCLSCLISDYSTDLLVFTVISLDLSYWYLNSWSWYCHVSYLQWGKCLNVYLLHGGSIVDNMLNGYFPCLLSQSLILNLGPVQQLDREDYCHYMKQCSSSMAWHVDR